MFHSKSKSKSNSNPALKGLKSAGPSKSNSQSKPKQPQDPTKGLKDALKLKDIQALAQEVASLSGS